MTVRNRVVSNSFTLHAKAKDGVTYQIVFTEAWARVDNSNNITARLRGNAYKIEGSTRTPLNNVMIRYGYILTDSGTYADTTTNSSGYFTEDNWFDGDEYGTNSEFNKGSKTIFAAIIINSEVKCVEHVLLVKDSPATIHYSLEVSTNQIRWGEDYAGLRWFNPASYNLRLIRYEGSTATVLSSLPSGYHLYYFAYDGDTLVDSGSSQFGSFDSDSEFSYVNVCDKVEYILCTDSLTPASPDSAHNVIGNVVVTASRDYYRMLIPAGTYQSKLYVRDDSTTPLVYYNNSYWYLEADSNNIGTVQNPNYEAPSDNSNCWKRATNEFQVILTQMLFTEFARMGGFIVYNNFFISQYGTLIGNNTADVKVNVSNVGTQYSGTKNSQAFTSVPYGWFDGSDPMGETVTSGTTYKFRPMKVVNALTGEEWMAEGKVLVSANGDLSIKGAMMSDRVTLQTLNGASAVYLLWDGSDDMSQSTALQGSVFILTGEITQNVEIFLPPPARYPGLTIEILITDKTASSYEMLLEVGDVMNDSYQDVGGNSCYPFWHPEGANINNQSQPDNPSTVQRVPLKSGTSGRSHSLIRLTSGNKYGSNQADGYNGYMWYVKEYARY